MLKACISIIVSILVLSHTTQFQACPDASQIIIVFSSQRAAVGSYVAELDIVDLIRIVLL